MANRKVTINIATTANTAGANQATAAMENLASASTRAATATGSAAKGAGRAGQITQQAGYQVQDFAVQVGGGTSALTAFSQQAPQLLGVFGPAGAVAGAVVAIGAVATQVFMKMGEDTETAAEKAKKLEDALEKIREAAEKAIKDKIDFGRQKIEDATTAAQQLAAQLNNAAANQLKLNKATTDSFDEIFDAEQLLASIRSGQADELQLQVDKANEQARRREQAVQQEISEEELKVKVAEDALTIAQENLAEKQKQLEVGNQDLKIEYEKLVAARELLKVTRETAKEKVLQQMPTGRGFTGVERPSKSAVIAKEELASGAITNEIEVLKEKVAGIAQSISNTGSLTKDVSQAVLDVKAVESELQITSDNVKTAIAEINIDKVSEDITAQAETLKDRSELLADSVEKAVEGVEVNNASQQKSLELIKRNLIDGGIQLDEVNGTATALSNLNPVLRAAIDGNTQQVSQLIRTMQQFKTQSEALQRKIDDLQRRSITPMKAN
jgi:DNA repair exonuclease SbcCD ATPase subunit